MLITALHCPMTRGDMFNHCTSYRVHLCKRNTVCCTVAVSKMYPSSVFPLNAPDDLAAAMSQERPLLCPDSSCIWTHASSP
jgi:hypothetical protein